MYPFGWCNSPTKELVAPTTRPARVEKTSPRRLTAPLVPGGTCRTIIEMHKHKTDCKEKKIFPLATSLRTSRIERKASWPWKLEQQDELLTHLFQSGNQPRFGSRKNPELRINNRHQIRMICSISIDQDSSSEMLLFRWRRGFWKDSDTTFSPLPIPTLLLGRSIRRCPYLSETYPISWIT